MCTHVGWVDRPFSVSVCADPFRIAYGKSGAWRAESTKFKTRGLTFSLGGKLESFYS